MSTKHCPECMVYICFSMLSMQQCWIVQIAVCSQCSLLLLAEWLEDLESASSTQCQSLLGLILNSKYSNTQMLSMQCSLLLAGVIRGVGDCPEHLCQSEKGSRFLTWGNIQYLILNDQCFGISPSRFCIGKGKVKRGPFSLCNYSTPK